MQAIKLISIIFCSGFLLMVSAKDTTMTVVFQNGLNEYTGCTDAYVGTNTWGTKPDFAPATNYGDKTELKVHKESC
jgi:hypothetical protein